MNITHNFSNILLTSFKNRISLSFFLRCWYSPRRIPVKRLSADYDLPPDYNRIENIDTLVDEDILPNAPPHTQWQSVIQKTAQEWDDKKAQERDDFLLPSQKHQIQLDMYSDDIKNTGSVEELFNLYKKNFEIGLEQHYILILQKLAEFTENGIIEPNELHEMVTFKTLLFLLWKRIRTLTNVEVMELLQHLTAIKVQTNSLMLQSLLQMIKFQINYMDGLLLLQLHNILCQHDDIPLVVALKEAIVSVMKNECLKPIAFLTQADTLKIIEYCGENNIEIDKLLDDVKEVNIADALESDDKYSILSKFLKSILLPSADNETGRTDQYELTVNFLLHHLTQDEGKEACLCAWDQLAPRLKTGLNTPLSEEAIAFLDQVYAWSQQPNRWNCQQNLAFHKDFADLAYVNTTLVDNVIKDIMEDKDVIPHDVIRSTVIAAFAAASDSMEDFIQNVISNYDFSSIQYDAEWLHVAVILLLRKQCPEKLLQQLFSGDYLSQCLEDNKNIYDNLLNLNRIINLLPNTDSVLIASEVKAQMSNAITEFPFQRTVFGDVVEKLMKKNFIPGVISAKHIPINFLIVVNSHNKPVHIYQDYTRKYSYMQFRGKPKIEFAVLEVPSALISKPTNNLAASIQADTRILTEEGFTVLFLKEDILNGLDDDGLLEIVDKQLRKGGILTPKLNIKSAIETDEKVENPFEQYRLDLPETESEPTQSYLKRHKLVIHKRRPTKKKSKYTLV